MLQIRAKGPSERGSCASFRVRSEKDGVKPMNEDPQQQPYAIVYIAYAQLRKAGFLAEIIANHVGAFLKPHRCSIPCPDSSMECI